MTLWENSQSAVDHTNQNDNSYPWQGLNKNRSTKITFVYPEVSHRESKLKYGTSAFLEVLLFSNSTVSEGCELIFREYI